MKETVIAIFDIGKTNKKVLLFNGEYRIISELEQKFPEIKDDDGFECDDIEHIESWIKETISSLLLSDKYELKAVNFTTYGATIAYLDEHGERLTPVYNYLKPMDEKIPESRILQENGIAGAGNAEFRITGNVAEIIQTRYFCQGQEYFAFSSIPFIYYYR